MYPFSRVILIVLDSVGIGYLPDAEKFGDQGANTIGHIYESVGLSLPHMAKLGLSRLTALEGETVYGAYAKLMEQSAGKDTTSGHWEIAGVILKKPFCTFPKGFPKELIRAFEKQVGRKVVCNRAASGTQVIEEYGPHHLATGDLIVYTSADSVFQIAAHEEVIPPKELYRICQIARKLTEPYGVARVIARPFVGTPGHFTRTANRKDFSLPPPLPTLLDKLLERGIPVISVGKIADIFAQRGITYAIHTSSNMDGVDKTLEAMESLLTPGLIFTNLVDFDSRFGHRRNPVGYRDALEEWDKRLPEILSALREKDLLLITSDHGNDPTFRGTDHTREYTFLLAYHSRITPKNLGVRQSFADIGATIAENFQVSLDTGKSFLKELLDKS